MKKIAWTFVVVLLAGALVLGGCTGQQEPADQAEQGETEKGGTLVIANVSDMTGLDPIHISDAPSSMIAGRVYDQLIARNTEGEHVAELAKDWEVTDNGKVWTFELQEGVTFHDGSEFNAEVVKFHINRVKDEEEGSAFRSKFLQITEVKVLDEYKVQMILEEPNVAFIDNVLTTNAGYIPSMKAIKEKGDQFPQEPVGSGPFAFDEWVSGEEVVLSKNEDYWKGAPQLDQVVFRVIPEASTQIMELETGGVNYVLKVPKEDLERLENNEDINVYSEPGYNVRTFFMNPFQNPFQDVKVRKAVNLALNVDSMVEALAAGLVSPADCWLPQSSRFHPDEVPKYGFDLEEAKALLEEAGWVDEDGDGIREKDGQKLEVTIMSPDGRYIQDKQFSEAAQAQLKKIGMDLKVQVKEWGSFVDSFFGAEFQMAFIGWAQSTGEASIFLDPWLKSDGRANVTGYSNEEIDQLLDQALKTTEFEARKDLYEQVIEKAHEEALWVYLYSANDLAAVRSEVKGYVHSPAVIDFTDVWIQK